MYLRSAAIIAALVLNSSLAIAQDYRNAAPPPSGAASAPANGGWRRAPDDGVAPLGETDPSRGGAAASGGANPAPIAPIRASSAKVSKGPATLPNDHGQVMRQYDIRSYTVRVSNTNKPEQAIVDWILRETGYEVWHGEPLGFLSASNSTLTVYHTPEIQAVCADIVDRFVSSEAESQAFGLRVVTINNPNWRAKAQRILKPVPVQSQGVQGWLVAKEDAALLMADLRKRSDMREHSAPQMMVHNGQSALISTMRPRQYVRNVFLRETPAPMYEPEMAQIDEGFALEFSPLMCQDGKTVDAIIKLKLSQVEQMVPVTLELPTAASPRQKARIDVPQVTMCNLHERFRWPTDQVLLLSMGVVATPAPVSNGLADLLPIPSGPDRADALLLIDCKGKVLNTPPPVVVPQQATIPLGPRRY